VTFFLDQQTLRTGVFLAKTTLVLGRQITFTVLDLAIHQKLVFLFDHIVPHRTATLLNHFVVPSGLTHIARIFDTDTFNLGTIAFV
jgi:hypothetical protein